MNMILYYVIAKLPRSGSYVIYQKTNTLVFQSHKETDVKIDAETLTMETSGRELEDVF